MASLTKRQQKRKAAKEARLKRLMARLTLLNAEPPQPGDSEHRRKTWADERAQILRQLKRHGIETE